MLLHPSIQKPSLAYIQKETAGIFPILEGITRGRRKLDHPQAQGAFLKQYKVGFRQVWQYIHILIEIPLLIGNLRLLAQTIRQPFVEGFGVATSHMPSVP